MTSRMGVMSFLLALLVAPAIGYGASPFEEGATIIALGYGAFSIGELTLAMRLQVTYMLQ